MNRKYYIAGAIFGLLGVIIGAFATHGLQPLLSNAANQSFETGVKYQMYHALLLIILGSVNTKEIKLYKYAFYFIVTGVILFSGSIYFLATNNLTTFDFKSIALITPLGGTILIVGWILILFIFIKLKNK